jgi:hypothetical protein
MKNFKNILSEYQDPKVFRYMKIGFICLIATGILIAFVASPAFRHLIHHHGPKPGISPHLIISEPHKRHTRVTHHHAVTPVAVPITPAHHKHTVTTSPAAPTHQDHPQSSQPTPPIPTPAPEFHPAPVIPSLPSKPEQPKPEPVTPPINPPPITKPITEAVTPITDGVENKGQEVVKQIEAPVPIPSVELP